MPFSVSQPLSQDDIKILLAEEMKDRFVGPMPAQKFMDDYLPRLPGQECPHVDEQHFRKIPEGASEKSFYVLLVDAMKPFTPGFEVIDTSQHPSSGLEYGGFKLRPDVALYPENCGRTKIIWRFSLASSERMGLDQSVTEVAADFDGREICTKLKLPPSTKLFYYGVPDDDISRAQRDDPDLTSLHWAASSRSDRVVYLKDTRRIESNDMQKEGDTYRQLHSYQVPHIAPFERGNDLEGYGSRTVTHDYVEESWVCGMPFATGRIYYPMVLGVVGRELSTFRSTRELVNAVADALEAHEDAYHKAGILHRDVSVGNLIVTDDGEGLLIDWDLCRKCGTIQKRRHDRTGTWQFMSGALLSDPTKHQDFEDDLESFLHVLTWTSIRYCPSNLTAQERSYRLSLIFEEVHETNGVYIGGDCKCGGLVRNKYLPSELVAFSAGSPLLDLLREINPPFAVRYQVPPSKEDFHTYETIRTSVEDSTTPFWVNIFANLTYGRYQQKLENLKRRSWFPLMIRAYLQNPDLAWPTDDKAERLPVGIKAIFMIDIFGEQG
ncbi:uncharacterized protein F5891DRAFT_1240372 [Suillus fuscotomentosus]|uniref:Fungal-type protein kinase domain-containing protein n=1 Tax=Suillus fuscotomentosus TaxID=1912939 RepID=A0AAD4E1X9_9AGAM|nr:uncharacterized protein F5891DRAFT_1240372 [Suillus fuscotomentosus]KAG1898025.1 hypothetical protein F5891DRAFT_1240372 [Suillus fuscotomentosus]